MMFSNKQLIGLGVVGLGVAWYLKKKAADVVEAVNPLNNNNVFYGGVNNVGAALSGDDSFSLGGWVYEVINE